MLCRIAPGRNDSVSSKDLLAIWRTKKSKRFQNYEAFFNILDTGKEPISKKWLVALRNNDENAHNLAPNVWKEFIKEGTCGIIP